MKSSTIYYLKSLNPIELVDKPSKETVEFVAKIINHDVFIEFIENVRNQNNFPAEGLDLKQFVGINFNELPQIVNVFTRDALFLAADRIRERMNIHIDFTQQIFLLIYYNCVVDAEYFEGFITEDVDFAVTKKEIVSKLFDYQHELGAIFIPYTLSFNNFMKKAKDVWEELQKEMDSNLTDNPWELRLHKNTELALKIVELKDHEELSFKVVTDKIFDESDKTDEKLSKEEYIKKIYYDYKALWKSPLQQQKS